MCDNKQCRTKFLKTQKNKQTNNCYLPCFERDTWQKQRAREKKREGEKREGIREGRLDRLPDKGQNWRSRERARGCSAARESGSSYDAGRRQTHCYFRLSSAAICEYPERQTAAVRLLFWLLRTAGVGLKIGQRYSSIFTPHVFGPRLGVTETEDVILDINPKNKTLISG